MSCSRSTSSTGAISAIPTCFWTCLEASGLDEAKAREVLEKRTYQAAVDADWEKSRQYGVTGVPTFVAGPGRGRRAALRGTGAAYTDSTRCVMNEPIKIFWQPH
jgi:ribosomal protein S11